MNKGIGWAVKHMQVGHKVRRAGWNGKNMHLYLWVDGASGFEPCVVMFTAQGLHQPGWLCSQADLLALDWEVVT